MWPQFPSGVGNVPLHVDADDGISSLYNPLPIRDALEFDEGGHVGHLGAETQ